MKTLSRFSFMLSALSFKPFAFRFLLSALSFKLLPFSFMLSALCFMLLAANPIPHNHTKPDVTNILLQSKDGGKTWEDLSHDLPDGAEPEDFFVGETEMYVRVNSIFYRSKSNLKTPVWEKESVNDPRNTSFATTRSRIIAFNYEGQMFQRTPKGGTYLPIYTNFKNRVRSVSELSDGTMFLGSDNGFYKSSDRGQTWKEIESGASLSSIAEFNGVLIGTGQKGIMRSTDKGEHWEWVIREGGVGIAVEQIEGGFAAIVYNTTTLARRVHISLDNGKTWKVISDGLNPSMFITSVKQVGKYLLCGHPDGIFRTSDFGKTWEQVHSSVVPSQCLSLDRLNDRSKTFKLHVSGNVVYAVAMNAGC